MEPCHRHAFVLIRGFKCTVRQQWADATHTKPQVLEIRSGVRQVCEALEQPLSQENKQHLAATLQVGIHHAGTSI